MVCVARWVNLHHAKSFFHTVHRASRTVQEPFFTPCTVHRASRIVQILLHRAPCQNLFFTPCIMHRARTFFLFPTSHIKQLQHSCSPPTHQSPHRSYLKTPFLPSHKNPQNSPSSPATLHPEILDP